MSKKKSKRSKAKYPALDPSLNLKSRRDYLDNKFYVKRLPEELKEWLNDFNQAYYCNSTNLKFENFEIVDRVINKEEEADIKSQISRLKKERRRIWAKSPDNVTDDDRLQCQRLDQGIDLMEEFLDKVIPMRRNARNNYARNEDFLNMSKANNTYDLVSWETLRDDELSEVQEEGIFLPFEWDDKED